MKDHVGEELVHVDDGDEEAEYVDDKMTSGGQVCRLSFLSLFRCDEEWTEHLPLSGRGDVKDKDSAADKAVTTEVSKSIDLFK